MQLIAGCLFSLGR